MLLMSKEKIIAVPILFGLFIFLVIILSTRTAMRIKKTGVWFFKDLWHVVDIALIILSLGCVCVFYWRELEIKRLLDSLEGMDPKRFPKTYFPLLDLENIFLVLCTILIAVATIKLWYLFRFIKIIKIVERTIKTAFLPLCALFFCNAIVILGFASFAFPMFVDRSLKYEGFLTTLERLILLNFRALRGEELKMLKEPKVGLGYVFYVSYILAVLFFDCFYAVIIIVYYSKAQNFYSNYSAIYSVRNHIKDQSAFYYNVWKMRFKSFRLGGGRDRAKKPALPISPKADGSMYAESSTLCVNKLKAMALISLSAIRNSNPKRKPLTQKDIRIMTYALYYLRKCKRPCLDDEEAERYYKGHMGRHKVKVMHDCEIKKVGVATSILLGEGLAHTLKELNININNILMEENIIQMKRMQNQLSLMWETVNKISVKVIFPENKASDVEDI